MKAVDNDFHRSKEIFKLFEGLEVQELEHAPSKIQNEDVHSSHATNGVDGNAS